MNHFGHILVGLAAGFVTFYLLSTAGFAVGLPLHLLVAISALGALLPDVDLKQSKISRVAQLVFVVGGATVLQPFLAKFLSQLHSWIVAIAVTSVALFLILFPLRLKHRGVTHSFGAAAIFAVIIGVVMQSIGAGIIALVSYASHLAVDKL